MVVGISDSKVELGTEGVEDARDQGRFTGQLPALAVAGVASPRGTAGDGPLPLNLVATLWSMALGIAVWCSVAFWKAMASTQSAFIAEALCFDAKPGTVLPLLASTSALEQSD